MPDADVIRLIPAHAGKTPRHRSPRPHPAAHPRSRGENSVGAHAVGANAGSSPLTRGKLCSYPQRWALRGLIPAHAGKTLGGHFGLPFRSAHPRSRGENGEKWDTATPRGGSSPLTRGKRRRPHPHPPRRRLIPAHAGKTSQSRWVPRCASAHPRSRGENGVLACEFLEGVGSSPLTRGKPGRVTRGMHARGLIPAHAGKTGGRASPPAGRPAHPRSRGENDEAFPE